MNKLTLYSIDTCEEEQRLGESYIGRDNVLLSSIQQTGYSIRFLIHGILIVLLFNICVLGCGYVLYAYMNTLQDEQRRNLNNFICITAAIFAIVLLFRAGDASKGRPDFYYI